MIGPIPFHAVPGGRLAHRHYWDDTVFATERDRLFARTWQFLGLSQDRTLAAEIAGLRYDATYGGSGWDGVCRSGDKSWPLAFATVGSLLFARVANADRPSLADSVAPFADDLALATEGLAPGLPEASVAAACNWKLLIENTLDDFHGPTVHPNTIHPAVHADWQTHLTTSRAGANSSSAWLLADETAAWWAKLDEKMRFRRFRAENIYRHIFIFPNFYLASFFGAMVIAHRIDPVAADRSVLRWRLFLPGDEPRSPREAALLRSTAQYLAASARRVIEEDRPVCEAVQRGRPGALGDGIYGLREQRLLDFQATVAAILNQGDG